MYLSTFFHCVSIFLHLTEDHVSNNSLCVINHLKLKTQKCFFSALKNQHPKMSQQQQKQPQIRQIGMVWEGEWPAVKEIVRTTRRVTVGCYSFLHDALYFPGAATAVSNSLHTVDNRVHRSSLFVAKYLNQTSPWLPQASTVILSSLIVTVKSNHYWGPIAASRNGLITLATGSLFFFPSEIRDLVFSGFNRNKNAAESSSSNEDEN